MAAFFDDEDMVEQIVIRLDVKDLIRCKSVCKSWYSLISSCGFINRHLSRNYNEDRHNNELGHRRLSLTKDHSGYHHDYKYNDYYGHVLVGCSNGLVCLTDFICNLLVCNPWTQEERNLKLPSGIPLCWGFGYDSSRDDYKVIVGVQECENQTCFQVLSLKSNVWKDIGEVKQYTTFSSKVGVLCNGALHWIVNDDDKSTKKLIVSYDLSKEKFKEIPRPNKSPSLNRLGIVKGCLCLYNDQDRCVEIWLMKNYDTWELLSLDHERKFETVHRMVKFEYSPGIFLGEILFSGTGIYTCPSCRNYILSAPVFVKSLVSPYGNTRRKLASTS